jgi:uncharacterized membrane-anchored protein
VSEDNKSRNAAAGQKQRAQMEKDSVATHHELSDQGLTKRNEEFMFQLGKQLDAQGAKPEKKTQAVEETLTALIEGQKTGTTAKQLFGTPTAYATEIVKGPVHRGPREQSSYKLLALDNGLMFFNIFAFMFGLLSLFSPKSMAANQTGTSGITAIILVAVSGGLLFAWVTKVLSPAKKGEEKKPVWYKILSVVAALIAWVAIYFAASLMPTVINPTLPGIAYVVLAVLGFLADMYVRRRFNIVGGAFAGGQTQQSKK